MKRSRRNSTIKSYEKILKKDFDFDWQFMLDLEKHKLKRMHKYFTEHNFTAADSRVIRELGLAIKLIEIICDEDFDRLMINGNFKKYVNIKNYKRFVTYTIPQLNASAYFRSELRVEKAWNLYHKLRQDRMRTWWN